MKIWQQCSAQHDDNFFFRRFPVLFPARLARRLFPPWVWFPPGGVQLNHLGEGTLRGELWLPLRDGGGGQRGEVLEVYDHLQEAPQCSPVQRE